MLDRGTCTKNPDNATVANNNLGFLTLTTNIDRVPVYCMRHISFPTSINRFNQHLILCNVGKRKVFFHKSRWFWRLWTHVEYPRLCFYHFHAYHSSLPAAVRKRFCWYWCCCRRQQPTK